MKASLIVAALAVAAASPAVAQVTVKDPWVRATVPQQDATGAFMQLGSPVSAKLVEARSPVAGVVELHRTTMENNVARMRRVEAIDIPAGQGAALAPGGYHVMLMRLKLQIKEGDSVPITLVVESGGKRETLEVAARARAVASADPHKKGH